MRVEDITKIIDGKLQNLPSIEQINSFKINPDNIESGDLFLDIHGSTEKQKIAIKNGAYAIVSENITQIIDTEIAWIEVDSLRLSCIKLSRYEFSKKNCSLVYLDDISEEIFHTIIKDKTFEKFPSNVYKTLLLLKKNGDNVRYTCSDERLAYSIDPLCQSMQEISCARYLKQKSPFYSSFIYLDTFYQNIKIPEIFIQNFCKVIKFINEKKINYDISTASMLKHFMPIFINNELNKKEFGQSTKAVIFEKNIDYIDLEIKHLQNFTNDTIICIPKKYGNCFKNYEKSYFFADRDELKELLKDDFRYALIFGNVKDYYEIFNSKKIDVKGLF